MKTKKITFLIILSLMISISKVSSQVWEYVYQNLTGTQEVTRLQFLSNTVGYALFGSQIKKTTDSGATWNVISDLPTGIGIKGMWFIKEQTAIITGQSGKIYRTTDGGATWVGPKVINVGTTVGQNPITRYINNLIFKDATTGYAFGNFGTLLKTTDAGETWTRIFDEASAADQHHFNAGMFTTTGTLYIAASWGYMYKMKDGLLTKTFNNLAKTAENFGVYAFSDDKAMVVGYRAAGGNSDILTTIDAGATWLPNVDVFTNTGTLRAIAFSSPNNGIVVGDNGLVLTTTNAGDTWRIDDTVYPIKFNSISITPNGTIFVGGVNTIMRKAPLNSAVWEVTDSKIKIYPTVVSDILNISSDNTIQKIKIHNLSGVELFNTTYSAQSAQINMTSFSNGVYCVLVYDNHGVRIQRIIR
jgi:photosystem II stability/assembly factor-like uncharacterized protein